MEIQFETSKLIDYYQCNYKGKQVFSEIILVGYRKVITKMIEADSLTILSTFRRLNIEKYENHWSARINNQFRLEFDFMKPNTIHITRISKHYE